MGKFRDFLARLGISAGEAVSDSKVKKAAKNSLEEKRKAAREHMRKLRARRKSEGYTAAELERRRAYNREFMRKHRAK